MAVIMLVVVSKYRIELSEAEERELRRRARQCTLMRRASCRRCSLVTS
jgi:hypothetical protein